MECSGIVEHSDKIIKANGLDHSQSWVVFWISFSTNHSVVLHKVQPLLWLWWSSYHQLDRLLQQNMLIYVLVFVQRVCCSLSLIRNFLTVLLSLKKFLQRRCVGRFRQAQLTTNSKSLHLCLEIVGYSDLWWNCYQQKDWLGILSS